MAELYNLVKRTSNKMKNKLYVILGIFMSSAIFTSCTKSYTCQCTSNFGVVTQYTVTAKTIVAANKNCDEYGLGNCELK